jgi:hypothetical protein
VRQGLYTHDHETLDRAGGFAGRAVDVAGCAASEAGPTSKVNVATVEARAAAQQLDDWWRTWRC